MIRKATTFVLGAGANVPYDFSSGRELMQAICGLPNSDGAAIKQADAEHVVNEDRLTEMATPSLTLGIYVHHDRGRMRETVARLPGFEPPVQALLAAS